MMERMHLKRPMMKTGNPVLSLKAPNAEGVENCVDGNKR